jgi:hypothetical protein
MTERLDTLAAQALHQLSHQLDPSLPPSIEQIQQALKTALEFVGKYHFRHSLELLSQIMDSVSTHCEALSLAPDDAPLCNFDRHQFWQGLNDTWLFAIQCAANAPAMPDQCLSEDEWIALRDSVIAWGDVLEWFGLVDYEMGLWEEDILDAIHLRIHNMKSRSSNV